MKVEVQSILKSIPLSNNTVKHRIDDMANNIEEIINSELKETKFALQLDESIFGCNNILMAYIRYDSKSKKSIR